MKISKHKSLEERFRMENSNSTMRLVELAGRLDYAASNHHLGSQRFGWEAQQKKEGGGSDSMVPNCKVEVAASIPKKLRCR